MPRERNLKRQTTLSLEEIFCLGAHHLGSLVDDHGRTYFNVFLGAPPEAVTDWPDFVDLPARYWEACSLIESVLGVELPVKDALRSWLFGHFGPDGFARRPDGPLSHPDADLFDQSRALAALVTCVELNPRDAEARSHLTDLANALIASATIVEDYAYLGEMGAYTNGVLIRPLMQAGFLLGRCDWVAFAGRLARGLIDHSAFCGPNGEFSGHVHSALAAVAGVLGFAIRTGDSHLLERAVSAFAFARSISTEFGFVPEHARHVDDIVACETCAIMDYLDCAILLARHVDPSYWDVVEKTTRNHLWESQIHDGSWLGKVGGHDEDGIVRSDLADRVVGAFTGWSAPHCSLANHETLWESWVRSEDLRPRYCSKVRALQNCCAGAGIRAAYQVWANIVTREADIVSVNLSLDRSTPDVWVTSYLPFEGRVTLTTLSACKLRWRPPTHCARREHLTVHGIPAEQAVMVGEFLCFGNVPAGVEIEITFALPERREKITIGNEGHQEYRFTVSWRGDTVLSVKPDPTNPATGFTHRMGKRAPTTYHVSGPGPLYQRSHWTRGLVVSPSHLSGSHSGLDWYDLGGK